MSKKISAALGDDEPRRTRSTSCRAGPRSSLDMRTRARYALWTLAAVSLGVLLLASAAGAAGPTFTEYSAGITPGSDPLDIAAGPDGNLWFTEALGDRIGKITPAGVVTEYSAGITRGSGPNDIASGPDGNLWFTENYGIGKITPAGVVTVYNTGNTEVATDIASGPDGNLWFTEFQGDTIGNITPAGVVTVYNRSKGIFYHGVFADGSAPEGIVAGPDGNLWVTENHGSRIAKITPVAGDVVVTEYSAGAVGGPSEIVKGPDGNLWFTEASGISGAGIGKITPAGVVTEYSAGITPGSGPYDIASGPDGNLWFTEAFNNAIGKITPAGVVTEYGHGGSRITAGPDGNLWFTEGSGKIGRLNLHAAAPHPACVVPKVVGKTLTKAKSAIRAAHCSTGKIRRLRSKKKAGLVISESPKPGRRLKNGAKVNLVVSRGRGR